MHLGDYQENEWDFTLLKNPVHDSETLQFVIKTVQLHGFDKILATPTTAKHTWAIPPIVDTRAPEFLRGFALARPPAMRWKEFVQDYVRILLRVRRVGLVEDTRRRARVIDLASHHLYPDLPAGDHSVGILAALLALYHRNGAELTMISDNQLRIRRTVGKADRWIGIFGSRLEGSKGIGAASQKLSQVKIDAPGIIEQLEAPRGSVTLSYSGVLDHIGAYARYINSPILLSAVTRLRLIDPQGWHNKILAALHTQEAPTGPDEYEPDDPEDHSKQFKILDQARDIMEASESFAVKYQKLHQFLSPKILDDHQFLQYFKVDPSPHEFSDAEKNTVRKGMEKFITAFLESEYVE